VRSNEVPSSLSVAETDGCPVRSNRTRPTARRQRPVLSATPVIGPDAVLRQMPAVGVPQTVAVSTFTRTEVVARPRDSLQVSHANRSGAADAFVGRSVAADAGIECRGWRTRLEMACAAGSGTVRARGAGCKTEPTDTTATTRRRRKRKPASVHSFDLIALIVVRPIRQPRVANRCQSNRTVATSATLAQTDSRRNAAASRQMKTVFDVETSR